MSKEKEFSSHALWMGEKVALMVLWAELLQSMKSTLGMSGQMAIAKSMKVNLAFHILLFTGSLGVLITKPVFAVPSASVSHSFGKLDQATGELFPTSYHQPPATSTQILVQSQTSPKNEVIIITGVKLNPTNDGIEIILETNQGEKLQVLPQNEGNTYIADLPNTQLRLPSGNSFSQEKPAVGITQVTISNQNPNTMRVLVLGETSLPKVELFDSDEGLIFGITPTTAPLESQQPTSPTKPPTQTQTEQTPEQPLVTQDEPETPIELVVTAQKFTETLQEVPISVTVIPKEELEDAQVNSLVGIANNVPNFSVFRFGGNRTLTTYTIRGLGNANVQNRDSVGFYIDDVPFDDARALDVDVTDLERVEVLRGAQSTLYGRNAQAGVINVISRPPSNTPEVRTAASYGSYNYRNLQLSFSDAIIPDVLRFRVAGAYTGRDGFATNTFLDTNIGGQSNVNGRAQILWNPDSNWTVSFNTFASDSNDGGTVFAPLPRRSNPFRVEQDYDGYSRLSTNTQALKIQYDGAGFQATSITTRRFFNTDAGQDADASAEDLFKAFTRLDSTTWSQEIRLQSSTNSNSDRFRWLIGGYFESKDTNINGYGYDLGPAFGNGFDATFADLNQTTYATFGQIEFKPIQQLTLIAGLRYESATTKMDRERRFTPRGSDTSAIIGTVYNDVEESSDQFVPRFGLEYQINPNLMLYGTVTQGYKPGGLNYFADNNTELRFNAETSWNYEVGLKSSWLDDRLGINLALFRTTSDNFQVTASNLSNFTSIIKNAEVEINGLELEARATPFPGFNLTAGLGYLDSKFVNYRNPFSGQDFSGNKLAFAPDLTYNLALQYRSPGGIFSRLELQGYGTYFFDESNRLKQSPFALVNARIGYEGDNYGIYLFANNLLNTEYLTYTISLGNRDIGSYGDRTVYGIQVRANF